MVGDAFEAALRARRDRVFRSTGVADTIGRLGDGEIEVVVLDVQLRDGTAWEVLDRIPSPHPPFRVSLVTAVDVAPPQRWAHIPLFRKPLGHQGLTTAVTEAVPYRRFGLADRDEPVQQSWLERVLLAEEPPLHVSIPVALVAIALVTMLIIPIRGEALGMVSAAYVALVIVIAAYAGLRVGIGGAVAAFLAFDFFMVPPFYTLQIATAPLVLTSVAFLAAATVGAVLVGSGRTLSRRLRNEAALSRLRLRLLSQTLGAPPDQLISVITRVISEALSETTELALVQTSEEPPDWIPTRLVDLARKERRTLEARAEGQTLLILPVGSEATVLAARTPAARISDQDRRMLGFAANELTTVTEQLALLKAAEAAQQLRAQDEAKTALLEAVSHDLRTPLSSIKVAVTTVLEPGLDLSDPQRRRLLHTVDAEVDRLTQMIDHLLDLSRLESGAFRLNRDLVDLARLARDAADRVRMSSGREIRVEVSHDTSVIGDSVRLLEVVTNLVDNAARHSTPGAPILVTARPDNGSVVVAVIDQGPGIPREEQEELFRPFTRGSRSAGGTGLGLAITRSIVHAHGGTIDVVSSPGTGTTMSVRIPRRALSD